MVALVAGKVVALGVEGISECEMRPPTSEDFHVLRGGYPGKGER